MSELAAVSSLLLRVIRDEALLLGGVRRDVQFIWEEMESMQGFLSHLERTVPTAGEYNEQIIPWKNQVRQLAEDCNYCIDIYMSRGNPEIHHARGGLLSYVWWLPWFVQKMAAQHRAAVQLRELKDRARDIGDRRLRYAAEMPAKGVTLSSSAHAATTSVAYEDSEEDDDDQGVEVTTMADSRWALLQSSTPEDNIRLQLAKWMIEDVARRDTSKEKLIPSIAIVAPYKKEALAVAKEASAMWGKGYTRRRSVLVDIPAVHNYSELLRTKDILYYILRVLRPTESNPEKQDDQFGFLEDLHSDKMEVSIYSEKYTLFDEIDKNIHAMKVDNKIAGIMKTIEQRKHVLLLLHPNGENMDVLESCKDEPIGVFLRALWMLKNKPYVFEFECSTTQSHARKLTTHSQEDIIKKTANMLEQHMKLKEAHAESICLTKTHYEQILREVFYPLSFQESSQATATRYDDQNRQMFGKTLQELQENKSDIKLAKAELEDKSMKKNDTAARKSNPDALIEETMIKIQQMHSKMKHKLKIKRIMDKINDCLKRQGCQDQILVILKLDDDYVSRWEETRNDFSLLGGIAGALMLTFEVNRAEARQYCWPRREPIDYSLLGLYRDTALELTKMEMAEDSWQILHDILDNCKSNEFCMKIFVHALYANPKRSSEELCKLCKALQQVSDNSMNNIAKKMLKFSYSDLPKDYKLCLMYLAIFPRRQPIRRSTLIGRWVVEGLVTKEDWESTVRHANQCFDVLVTRWLVYPADTSSMGQVKSCVIGDQVHGFITKIARKHGILGKRLSHHLARYFSIFNHLRLRSSDRIDKFFSKLFEESSRVSLIKVLDLEGCQCFGGKNQHYLKDICSKMLLLKYLSLRGTNLTKLPSEINNLRELEVLDIRQTRVPAAATVHVILLKLKRLLAGSVVMSSGPSNNEVSYVMVPDKIEKMTNMEVMSNVKARNSNDLKDIGKLWRLRKLGVVIEQKDKLIRNLLQTICDLHECLRSLSITLPITGEDSSEDNSPKLLSFEGQCPKILESLSIRGTAETGQLFQLLTKDGDQLQLAKVTLSGTRLRQADLEILAKLPKLVCLRLQDRAYIDDKLSFNKEKFKGLKCFLIEGSEITVLSFNGGAPKLEKIILSSTDGLQSLSRVEDLHELKEVELKNSNKLSLSLFEKAKNISKVTLCRTILCQDEVEILAKMPNMRSLVLKEISYAQSLLIFYKDDFPRLNLLTIDFSVITCIGFTTQSATKLEKIIWSYRKSTLLSGIDELPKLKELEFNGDFVPDEVIDALKKHKNNPKLIHNKPENQEAGNIPEKKDAPRFPLFWKKED
ncbi:hypothetical protein VPH35_069389 [Triticum aestivum]|nr:disease resistance protein Pik-2-like [Triticum aestivum]